MKSRLTADVAETYPFRNLFDDENQAGIAAKQALDKSHNKDVKAFAEAMVRDHEAVNKQALALTSPRQGHVKAYFRRFVMPSRGRVPAIPRPSAGFLTRGEAALAFGALRHGPSCSL